MPRRVSLVILLGLIIVVVLSFGITAAAAQEGEDSSVGGASADDPAVSDAQENLGQLRQEAATAAADYSSQANKKQQIEGDIAETQNKLAASEADLEKAQDNLSTHAGQMYRSTQFVGALDLLLGAENVQEFATKLNVFMEILGRENAQVQEITAARNQLEAELQQRQQELDEWQRTTDDADAKQKEATDKADAAEAYLDGLSADLRAALEAEQARQQQAAQDKAVGDLKETAQESPEVVQLSVNTPAPEPNTPPAESPSVTVNDSWARDTLPTISIKDVVKQSLPTVDTSPPKETPSQTVVEDTSTQDALNALNQDLAASQQAAAEQAQRANEQREAEKKAKEQAAEEAAKAQQARLAAQNTAEQRAAEEEAKKAAEQAKEAEQARIDAEKKSQEKAEALRTQLDGVAPAPKDNKAGIDAEKKSATPPPEGQKSATPPPDGKKSDDAGAPPPATAAAVLAEARTHIGTPYVLSPPGPCIAYKAEDCSCFTMLVYQKFGYSLPDDPGAQMGYGKPVSGPPQAADLVFFSEDGSGNITHVGIATGAGTAIIHASNYFDKVVEADMSYINGYVGARRLL